MSFLTRANKATLSTKVEETLGATGHHGAALPHILSAIRGGVLIDVVHLLLKVIRQDREDKMELNRELSDYEVADERNHALYQKTLAQLAEARREVEALREELITQTDYMDFHREDTEHIMDLSAQVKDLKAQLADLRPALATAQAELADLRPALATARAECEKVQTTLSYTNMALHESKKAYAEEHANALHWRDRAYQLSEELSVLRHGPIRLQMKPETPVHESMFKGMLGDA